MHLNIKHAAVVIPPIGLSDHRFDDLVLQKYY